MRCRIRLNLTKLELKEIAQSVKRPGKAGESLKTLQMAKSLNDSENSTVRLQRVQIARRI